MKSFLITSSLLFCLMLSSESIYGQRQLGNDNHHLLLTEHGSGFDDCSTPLENGDDISLKIIRTDYESELDPCSEMRIIIREQGSGGIIGISSSSDNWHWTREGDTCTFRQLDYALLSAVVDIELSYNPICDHEQENDGLQDEFRINVTYELVDAVINANYDYDLYDMNNGTCFDSYFPAACFRHEGNESSTLTGRLCVTCEGFSEGNNNYFQGVEGGVHNRSTRKQNDNFELPYSNTHIYPNPFENAFSLDYQSKDFNDLSVTLYTVEGKQVFQQVYRAANTTGTITVPTNTLAPGIYVCKFWDGETYQTFKLSKL